MLGALQALSQVLQDTSELVVIVFAAWCCIALKDNLVRAATADLEEEAGGGGGGGGVDDASLRRILVPVSNLASWVRVGRWGSEW